MSREERILHHINKKGRGIEIGPSYNPIAPKKDGYKVHVIDHMDREQLIEKYKNEDVKLDNIEHVDFVWKGETYSIRECCPPTFHLWPPTPHHTTPHHMPHHTTPHPSRAGQYPGPGPAELSQWALSIRLAQCHP